MQVQLDRLRIRLLFEQSFPAQIAGLTNIAVFAFVVRDEVAGPLLWSWAAVGVAITLLRFVGQTYILNRIIRPREDFSPDLWENVFCISTLMSGGYWASASEILLTRDMVTFQTFLAFIVAGLTAGAAVAYSSSVKAVMSFTFPTLVPFALSLLLGDSHIQHAMAGLICVYMFMIFLGSLRMNTHVVNSIRLALEKDQLLEKVKASQAEAIRSQKMAAVGMLAGGVAHEINTPLGIINLKIEEIAGSHDPHVRGTAEEVLKIVVRIAKIVSALKSFARTGANETAGKTVNVSKVISELVDICGGQFKNNGISLVVANAPEDCTAWGHSEEIGQALLNLLTNAFEATRHKSDSWVKLEVQMEETKIILSVTDNGQNIPAEIRSKLMQPFFTTKAVGTSPGLGLSTALGIARKHGGDLRLNESSEWTRFEFTLPRIGPA